MACLFYPPDRLRSRSSGVQTTGIVGGGMLVVRARHDKKWNANLPNRLNRPEIAGLHANSEGQLLQKQGRQKRGRASPVEPKPVARSRLDIGINGLQHKRIGPQIRLCKKRGSPSKRDADHGNGLAGKGCPCVRHRRLGVVAFAGPVRDVLARALAVGLQIYGHRGKPRLVKQAYPIHHTEAVAAHAVEQHHGSAAACARYRPAYQLCPRGASKRDLRSTDPSGRRTHPCSRRLGEPASQPPHSDAKQYQSPSKTAEGTQQPTGGRRH